MSALKLLRPNAERRRADETISRTRLQVPKHLKFFHSDEGALAAVEFEMAPSPNLLHRVYEALSANRVAILDASARLTPHSVYHRFELCEHDGALLFGVRRHAIEGLFLELLATIHDE